MKKLELKDLIEEEIQKIKQDKDYLSLNSFIDENLFESYWMLGELLNPTNSYKYKKVFKGYWVFTDDHGYDFFVRLNFQPIDDGYYEMKMGWVDLPKQQKYLRQTAREIDERRSDTVAKIFDKEIIPLFLKQIFNNNLKIFPLDIKRYQFAIRLVKKFIPNNIKIIENKPKEITLMKKSEEDFG